MKKLPYLPESREILYVPADDKFMKSAHQFAEKNSLDSGFKTGAVIVLNGKIIGQGANGSNFHQKVGCIRKFFHIKTGEKYWLCSGCSPHNHAEQSAIRDALKNNPPQSPLSLRDTSSSSPSKGENCSRESLKGADLYLWGHWWCCQSCWAKMIEVGIKNVYLSEEFRK